MDAYLLLALAEAGARTWWITGFVAAVLLFLRWLLIDNMSKR